MLWVGGRCELISRKAEIDSGRENIERATHQSYNPARQERVDRVDGITPLFTH